MKTRNIFRILLTAVFVLGTMAMNAQTKIYVYKTDGTAAEYNIADIDSISFTTPVFVDYTVLKINEVNGVSGQKWFEIYNTGDEEINLNDVKAYYSNSEPASYSITWTGDATQTILPKGYFSTQGLTLNTGLSANNASVRLQLRAPNGTPLDTYEKPKDINTGYPVIYNKSHARIPDGTGDWYYTTDNIGTPGATNGASTEGCTKFGEEDAGMPVVDYSGLVINEVDGNGKFVEIYNKGTEPVSLEGLRLVKNESGTWWAGGTGITIAVGGFYTVAQSGGAAGADEYTGANGISPKQNVKFELKEPDGTVIDEFVRTNGGNWGDGVTPDYGSGTQYSFSRCPDGTGSFQLAIPSCNSTNNASAGDIVTNP